MVIVSAQDIRVGDHVRIVRLSGMSGFDPWFGKIGVVKRVLTEDEVRVRGRSSFGRQCEVSIRDSAPTIVIGSGSLVVERALTDEALVDVKSSGVAYTIDQGEHTYLMSFLDIKLVQLSQESFWEVYEERVGIHRANRNVRHRAHSACNRWRCHNYDRATDDARNSHPLNLLIAATEPVFRHARRLSLEGFVEMCRAADKNEFEVADVMFHYLFENRETEKIAGLRPRCTCYLS